jgi:hypothetical protein
MEQRPKPPSLFCARNPRRRRSIALDRSIPTERLRRDVSAYSSRPLTSDELAVADLPVAFDLGDEDVDYDVIYARRR